MAPLLDNDMIDTMIIQVAPVLLGDGIPLFTQKESLKRFILEEVNRYVFLRQHRIISAPVLG